MAVAVQVARVKMGVGLLEAVVILGKRQSLVGGGVGKKEGRGQPHTPEKYAKGIARRGCEVELQQRGFFG